jgi:glycosyltransferase involved in cell wall biosynthesis
VRVALVSRELYPLGGGGIGQCVAAAARVLSQVADVTILTSSALEPVYEHLHRERDRRLPPRGVRVAFVPEPSVHEMGGWYDVMQYYGARVLERLRELYPDGGPDVIEFPDFLAEGFVTVQAAQALDPFLRESCVCVRIQTTAEIAEVLNGYYPTDLSRQVLHAMERHSLLHADRLIWPWGDVLDTYRRFYGQRGLAPAIRIAYPYAGPAVNAAADAGYRVPSPLSFLFIGRLERRKGVSNLVSAARGMGREDFRLTLAGGDTATGPLGVSMRELLGMAIADDARIELRDEYDRRAIGETVREHDVVVVPSLWECGPYVALEALYANRPVMVTPVGGLVEMAEPGVSGWRAEGVDSDALAGALERVLDDTSEVERMVRSGRLVARARTLCDEGRILDGYQELGHVKPRHAARRRLSRDRPLVSAIVPYYRASRYVRDTIESLLAQSYRPLEIVLVNDGSFEPEDWVVAELSARVPLIVVSEVNSGLGAARNLGISQCSGRYLFPLDADNFAHPEFVERCVEVLEHRREVAYVTSWSRYVGEEGNPRPGTLGYQPIGNGAAALLAREDVAGDAAAVIRRRIFDLGFRYSDELTACEDWHFYRELGDGGHLGAVIPERLLYYRVRVDSMQAEVGEPKRERILGEIEALLRENAMQWTPPSGEPVR